MILSQKLTQKWVGNMTEESYIIVYSIIYSQKLSEKTIRKMSEKNDWRIVYKTIYYDFEWKMSKKND